MTVFVDTSVFYAAVDSRDNSNKRAKRILSSKTAGFFTSEYVLVETWRLIQSRVGWAAAENFWVGLQKTSLRIEPVTSSDLERAVKIGTAFSDQEFSLVDRTSFALMERLGVNKVATFDSDFAIYRYGSSLDSAFELLR